MHCGNTPGRAGVCISPLPFPRERVSDYFLGNLFLVSWALTVQQSSVASHSFLDGFLEIPISSDEGSKSGMGEDGAGGNGAVMVEYAEVISNADINARKQGRLSQEGGIPFSRGLGLVIPMLDFPVSC